MSRSLAIVLLLVSSESAAWGYRPFRATDAAVADPKQMEFFPLSRSKVKYSAASSSRTEPCGGSSMSFFAQLVAKTP